jgi:hypothetical protein
VDGLPVALPAARWLAAPLDGLHLFREFQREGVWKAIWAELHAALRERIGRTASPSAGVLDSQTPKACRCGL